MSQSDKQTLHNLKYLVRNLQIGQRTLLHQILSQLQLALSNESILIYRYLNELFLCSAYALDETEEFADIKIQLLNQIDSVIGKY
jgi:hypothetical protein